MKTFVLSLDEFVEATTSKGHVNMRVMEGSAGRSWECGRCGARVYREGGELLGWAVDYTCDEVNDVVNPGAKEEQ